MAKELFANNAKGRLLAGISNLATAFSLQAGQGALFPAPTNGDFARVTLTDTLGNKEICTYTARVGDDFSGVARAQEGTVARSYLANDRCGNRLTKEGIEGLRLAGSGGFIDVVATSETFDSSDAFRTKVITATAVLTLPDTADFETGEAIVFKSMTEGSVTIVPDGVETIDTVNAPYRLPSFCDVKVVKQSGGAWALLGKPEEEVGSAKRHMTNTLPLGYIWENGVPASRAAKGGLFAVYGTSFGPGDGSTTFDIPDAQGRVAVGRETMGGATAPNRVQTTTTLTTTTGVAAATVASAAGLAIGDYIYNANVGAGTKIDNLVGLAVTLSIVATGTGADTARFSGLAADPQTLGSAGGSRQVGNHSHPVTDPGHNHTDDVGGGGSNPNTTWNGTQNNDTVIGQSPSTTEFTGITVGAGGLGTGGNLQPGQVCNSIIKT